MRHPVLNLLLAAICGLAAPASIPPVAAAVNHTQGVLGATEALTLVIDGLDEEMAAHGLSRMKVEEAISSRLLTAGIQVLPENELSAAKNAGVLTLRVRLMRAPYFFYLYNINLTLGSKLVVNPDANGFTTVETWSDGWVGAMQPTDVGQLQGFAEELLARFLAQRAAERGS